MKHETHRKAALAWIPLIAALALSIPAKAQAQRSGSAGPATNEQTTRQPPRGRLPTYYARVVNEKQRTEIYEIQRRFSDQIAKLQAQMEDLINERDTEVEAVLTTEQREEVNKLREAARARRKARTKKASGDSGNPGRS